MPKIKIREVAKHEIKTLNKAVVGTEKLKDNLVKLKNKSDNSYSHDDNIYDYGTNMINDVTSIVISKGANYINKNGRKSVVQTKDNFQKAKIKIKKYRAKYQAKKKAKTIKNSKKVVKQTTKVTKESIKTSQKAMKLTKDMAKASIKVIKVTVKVTISSIKAIIAGTKALVSAIVAGGWVAAIIIIVICMVGLLCNSIFGIFLSSEKTSPDSITMNEVVAECNKEFSDRLQTIQNQNPHDNYILDGSMASWKDIISVYAVMQSKGNNEQEVITINEQRKSVIKRIFWDMNSLSSEVRTETVIEQGVNVNGMPKEVQRQVLHIIINSKNAEQMKVEYHFNSAQNMQMKELFKDEYSVLWNGVIYGSQGSGEYTNWRQRGASWSNIKIGNTNSTIGDIGCLVTSIAILIAKSGVSTPIRNFNPGTFVMELNKNGGFDGNGNLQYGSISKVVPNFKYMGKINLRGKTKEEKLSLITQYYNNGYNLTIEVLGATENSQHWVAITGINGNNIVMIDPGSNHTDLWNAYEYSKTSQFNYYLIK